MTLFPHALCCSLLAVLVVGPALLGSDSATTAEPIEIRVEPLTVPPATQPLLAVAVRNRLERPCQGRLTISAPDDWRIAPDTQTMELAAGAEKRFAFNIEKARNVEANRYPFAVVADLGDQQLRWQQTVFVASAPYARVTVDGRPDEWQEAIPVSFEHGGRQTTFSTFWSRKHFCVLVAVQEDRHTPYGGAAGPPCDAIQLAISPLEPAEASAERAGRFEFLLASAAGVARGFQLAAWDMPRTVAAQERALEPLQCDDVEIAIQRDGDVTYYECSLPFRLIREAIEPAEGREFYLSVLVHDPDGTGLRDLGRAAGLWPGADDAHAWSRWRGMAQGAVLPSDNRVRWGLCTSKY